MRIILAVLLLPWAAPAATLTLGASKDNSLYADSAGALSNGTGPTFFAGTTNGGGLRRGLIEFDLSALPAGSIVESVTLDLFLIQAQSFPTPVTLHEVLAEWGQGASSAGNRGGMGAGSTAGDATWIHTFYNNSFWAAPGGDFVSLASGSTIVGGEGASYRWASTAGLVEDVQGWVNNAATNHGWLLRGDESQNATAKAFGTKETSNALQQPVLTVVYTVPEPGVATGLLLGLGAICGIRRRPNR